MKIRAQDLKVADVVVQLKNAGAIGVETYERRLSNNAGNEKGFEDFLSEARVALMFLHHKFKVTMRESPDLQIELDAEVVYAEVKHFREKTQDEIDKKNMRESDSLVRVGNIVSLEGNASWEQVAQVAIKKAVQYIKDAPNLLVIETDSNSVKGIVLQTAVNIYDEQVSFSDASSPLRRLNGFILIDQWIWPGDELVGLGTGYRNVIFHQTKYPAIPLSSRLVDALVNVREG